MSARRRTPDWATENLSERARSIIQRIEAGEFGPGMLCGEAASASAVAAQNSAVWVVPAASKVLRVEQVHIPNIDDGPVNANFNIGLAGKTAYAGPTQTVEGRQTLLALGSREIGLGVTSQIFFGSRNVGVLGNVFMVIPVLAGDMRPIGFPNGLYLFGDTDTEHAPAALAVSHGVVNRGCRANFLCREWTIALSKTAR